MDPNPHLNDPPPRPAVHGRTPASSPRSEAPRGSGPGCRRAREIHPVERLIQGPVEGIRTNGFRLAKSHVCSMPQLVSLNSANECHTQVIWVLTSQLMMLKLGVQGHTHTHTLAAMFLHQSWHRVQLVAVCANHFGCLQAMGSQWLVSLCPSASKTESTFLRACKLGSTNGQEGYTQTGM